MKILTKADPESRNRELLASIHPPYRVRISLQVKNQEGDYKPVAGSLLVSVKTPAEVTGILEKIQSWIEQAV